MPSRNLLNEMTYQNLRIMTSTQDLLHTICSIAEYRISFPFGVDNISISGVSAVS